MARLIGYMANRADRLLASLHQERAGIDSTRPPSGPEGFGIGFYQGGEVLHKKRPRAEGLLDWREIARGVSSDCVLLHMLQPTVGDFRVDNAHPFRFRSWLFAHHGTISRFEAVAPAMRESLPDFLQRNVRGKTDSELFFHLVLSFIHDAGRLDDLDIADDVVVRAIRSSVALIDRLTDEVEAPPATLSFVLTNGRAMFAFRRGADMGFVERRGLHDPPEGLIPATGSGTLRFVMVAAGPSIAGEFSPIPESAILAISRDLSVMIHE